MVAPAAHHLLVTPRTASRLRSPPARPAVPLITLADGFLVESEGRTVVHVDVATGGIVVHLAGRAPLAFGLSTGGLDDASRTVALVVRRAIGRRPRQTMVAVGSPRQRHLFGSAGDDVDLAVVGVEPPSGGSRERSGDRLQPLLRAAILERAQAVARRRDARIDAVAARVGAMVDTPLVYSSAVLETPWLIDDVLRFKAAAIAVAMAETLPPPVRADAGVRALIPFLSRWRSLFAPDGQVTRAVSKTLALLDEPAFRDVDARDVWRLQSIALVQPVRSPRHLHLLAERQQLGGPALERDLRLLQLADDDAIDDAIDDVARTLRLQRLALRQREHVLCEVLGQAGDRAGDERLPAAHAVRTLVRRRLDAVRAARRRPAREGSSQVAVAPPIPLPVDRRLRFLVSEDDFLDEGERMHHCVGTYFASAVDGEGYFFHFHDGDGDGDGAATVRVSPCGVVLESRGPCNARTPATLRATRALSAWGAPLSLLSLGAADACIWHGDGPTLDDDERPLRTLVALVQAVTIELETDTIRDVVVYLDLVRSAAEQALLGRSWLYFDPRARRVRARAGGAADDVST